jgi:hypothetical protein
MIRSIYVYHVKGRGWRDIGYNFLVDRFGRIWEGRWGGVGRAVIGAHVIGYNDEAMGVSALGTYSHTPPSPAMLGAFVDIFAWKFGVHHVKPGSTAAYRHGARSVISGHRDGDATECPGDALYAQLPVVRFGVASRMSPGWGRSHDFTRDGVPDLVARRRDASLWLYPGNGRGGFKSAVLIARDWSAANLVVAPGDWDGDRVPDVLVRMAGNGSLRLYPGRPGGRFGPSRQVSTHWRSFNAVIAPGDWDRDGNPDLLARRAADGTLLLYRGNGTGGFLPPRAVGSGWQHFSLIG